MTDQHFLSISYGNEDKMEELEMCQFTSSLEVARYLRVVADRIASYPNSKAYRASEEDVLRHPDEGGKTGGGGAMSHCCSCKKSCGCSYPHYCEKHGGVIQ